MKIPADLQPYWNLLKDLDDELKLELIEVLVRSLREDVASRSGEPQVKRIKELKEMDSSQRLEKIRRFAGDAAHLDLPTSKNDVYEQ